MVGASVVVSIKVKSQPKISILTAGAPVQLVGFILMYLASTGVWKVMVSRSVFVRGPLNSCGLTRTLLYLKKNIFYINKMA